MDIDLEDAAAEKAARIEAYNEGVDDERERCASIAEHLNGWGKKPNQELANHIARMIREQSRI